MVKFYDYKTYYEERRQTGLIGKSVTINQFYDMLFDEYYKENTRNPMVLFGNMERRWYACRRPYYDCYTQMSAALSKVPIGKIPLASIFYPEDSICLRFSSDQDSFLYNDKPLRSLLFSLRKANSGNSMIWAVNCQNIDGYTNFLLFASHIKDGHLDADDFIRKASDANKIISNVYSLILAIGLLGKDSELVSEIITKKYERMNLPHDEAVAKSRAKGLYGFSLGKNQEICPHFRADHLCNIAYGPKHSLRKIILRKGGIVKRTQATTVPTGYLDHQKEGSPTNAT